MDPKKKQKALRMISNGIYVLTSRSEERFGCAIITWLTQTSFAPPLVVAAVRPTSTLFECLASSGYAVVHILGAHQQDIARRFLFPTAVRDGLLNGEPFDAGKTSMPVLRNAPAYLECKVSQVIDGGGDHRLVVLEVVEAEHRQGALPLLVAASPWRYGG